MKENARKMHEEGREIKFNAYTIFTIE